MGTSKSTITFKLYASKDEVAVSRRADDQTEKTDNTEVGNTEINNTGNNTKESTPEQKEIASFNQSMGHLFELKESTHYSFPTSRASTTTDINEIELESDDVVEVELVDGGTLFLRADELAELTGQAGQAKNNKPVELSSSTSVQGRSVDSETSRGVVGDVFKNIKPLDIVWKGAADTVVEVIKQYIQPLEDQLLKDTPGLIHWDHSERSWGKVDKLKRSNQAVLIFLHGTASSTEGSFGSLWDKTQPHQKHWLKFIDEEYDGRVYAFNHRSLSESPARNAIDLLQKLGKNQELHLVSHSRGGLVGELLCRGHLEADDLRDPISLQDIELFKSAYLNKMDANKNRQTPSFLQKELGQLNKLLIAKRLKITRFVRVACPSKGTTLADERADLYLSVLFSLLEKGMALANPIAGGVGNVVKGLAIATAKMRMDFEALPGLECMMPGSGLIKMINYSSIKVAADLSIIAGNSERGRVFQADSMSGAVASLKQTLWVALTNVFYLQANDFVIETTAMDGGHKRINPAFIYEDKGGIVNHFNYFKNPSSRQQLIQALSREGEKSPVGFDLLGKQPVVDDMISRSLRIPTTNEEKETTGIVVIIPSLGGSYLSVDGERIWVSTENLALGKLQKLRYSSENEVSPESSLENHYGALVAYLSKNHQQDVEDFAYDWRLSIADNSQLLAFRLNKIIEENKPVKQNENKPIRLLAHGMGGLIVQHLMLTEPALWGKLHKEHDAQCLMAGTPFSGSYEIVQMLLQQAPLLHQLALLNPNYSPEVLASLLTEYPSIIEMLPMFNEEAIDHKFYTPTAWKRLHKAFGFDASGYASPDKKILSKAKKVYQTLLQVPESSQKIHYLAGQADETLAGLEADTEGIMQFMSSTEGDGLALWAQIPDWFDDNNIWYLPEVKHGDLFRHQEHFSAISELLLKGTTALLAHTAPHNRSLSHKKVALTYSEPQFLLPEAKDIEAIALHGSATLSKRYQVKQLAHVRIIHGDLSKLDTPIMVGHYIQEGIRGSEAAVDKQLKGWLTELYNGGLYPGRLNTVEVIIDPGSRQGVTKGAVIVGLGSIGELTVPMLRRTLRNAFIRYGLHYAELLKNCSSDKESNKSLILSTLLVGAGTGGVSVEDSVSSLLRALTEANDKLKELRMPTITRLDIVELFEDIAISTAMSLYRIGKKYTNSISTDTIIKTLSGKQVRPTISAYETWWRHMQILGESDGSLAFTPLTSTAGMQTTVQLTQTRLIDNILEQSTKNTSTDLQLTRTLFELLLPKSLKEQVRDENGMVLLLNESAARFPWEMLVSGQNYKKPMSTEIGFIRKLHSVDMNPRKLVTNHQALVVGDTKSNLVELRGAQEEAKIVQEVLLDAKFCSSEALIRRSGIEIVSALMNQPVQIMHLAGHGIFLEKGEKINGINYENGLSGMVLGEDNFLTQVEINNLPYVPELVFINCCHLGKMNKDDESQTCYFQSRSRLAANLGTAFIQAGAKCVIAAGWEVDDAAALTFADEFYFQMLSENENFGEASRLARKKVFDKHPNTNTWGAYQCYGDHKFSFKNHKNKADEINHEKHHSARQTIIWANNISNKTWGDMGAVEASIDKRSEKLPPEWQQDAELHEAIAGAYATASNFEKAIEWYDKAVGCNDSRITLKALEQKANVLVRWAEEEYNLKNKESDLESEQALEHINVSISLTNNLININKNKERLSVLASAYKHKAMIQFSSAGRITKEAKLNLCLAYDNYMQANVLHKESKQKHDSYSLLNAIGLWLGLDKKSCENNEQFKWLEKDEVNGYIRELDDQLEAVDNEKQYDFWERTDYLNCQLIKLLFDKSPDTDSFEILINNYADIFDTAKPSPRERNSVLKQIRFLDEFLSLAWKKTELDLGNLKELRVRLGS